MNQTIMIGPKILPMPLVPRCCTRNSAIRMTTVIGTMNGFEDVGRDAEAFDRAQHRDRRRDHAVAVEQRRAEQADRDQRAAVGAAGPARATSATSARMPPSPSLSARITNSTYLIDTVMISDQTISDSTPRRWRA